jgi:hypothetical protein
VLDVTPVWSEKALAGIGREGMPVDDEEPPELVVVVDDELLELHAAAPTPTARTTANAVVRLFQEPERKAPPIVFFLVDRWSTCPRSRDRADTDM